MRAGLLLAPLVLGTVLARAQAQDATAQSRDELNAPGYGVIDDRAKPAHAADDPSAGQKSGGLAIPKNQGWVTDLAGMLSTGERRELETLMESYKQGTTNEIALLTVPSLQGDPIERFALDVGRTWGIGGKDKNNGALLIVSKADRKIRIEVGRGLEGNLPDSVCGRIIRGVISPEFKRGRFGVGLKNGIVAIHEAIGGNYGKIPSDDDVGGGIAAGGVVLFILFLIFLRIAASSARRSGGSSFNPWLAAWLLSNSGSGRGRFGGGGGFSGGGGGGGFSGFGGGGGFSGGGASGGW